MKIEIKIVEIKVPQGVNLILGQSHFIETVENLSEALLHSVPGIKFGLGFVESSGECLVRHEGNDEELRKMASQKAFEIGAGHTFLILIKNAYPINVLNAIKNVPEVCNIFCATGNPVKVIIAQAEDKSRGILGVIDGAPTKGIEDEKGIKWRKEILRKLGYKF
ncbi:adenosine-specific kinase [Candidatus Parcubacteria bacterium]|nr:adenosine-specific kinase [Candidatus Parcubacteria bacterium]